jgi:pyruvate kinase
VRTATDLEGDGAFAPPLTTIIATIGPASAAPRVVARLIESGASIFRLNFSHGTPAEHESNLNTLRAAARECGRPIAVMGDLPGPKIRVRGVPAEGIAVEAGARVLFRRSGGAAARGDVVLGITSDALFAAARPGHRILVDEGSIRMLVLDREPDEITCTVTQGGVIRPSKGVNLPDTDLAGGSLSPTDLQWARWAVAHEIDFLAQSFVSEADDVTRLRGALQEFTAAAEKADLRFPIVAKIERPRAVERVESIVEAADAVMIARGDLGVEMEPAQVPVIQKQVIAAARQAGRPCIVATQMLQSMIESPIPTRAEASDVANAIFDQVDAVMLSGETAVGRYADLAVASMRRIADRAEAYLAAQPTVASPPEKLLRARHATAALAHGAWTVAQDYGARLIVVWSQHGGGARYLSRYLFRIPIVAVSTDERSLRHMQLLRGVLPVRMERPANLAEFTRAVDGYVLAAGWARRGDPCVLLAGGPIGTVGATNSLALHRVGDPDTGYRRHFG